MAPPPLEIDPLRRYSGIISLVTTDGCQDPWPDCPAPATNQFTFRYKSSDRLRDEMKTMAELTGIDAYFGTDDNFFNNRDTVEEIFTGLAKGTVHGKPFRDTILFGTEATEYDVFKNQDLLP